MVRNIVDNSDSSAFVVESRPTGLFGHEGPELVTKHRKCFENLDVINTLC